MSSDNQPKEVLPDVNMEFVETHPKYIKAIEEIMEDPLYRQKFWELHKEISCPVDANDKLFATYKNDPFRLNYTILQNAPIEDIKQFVDKRVISNNRNKISNLTGFSKEFSEIVDDINFLLYCKSVEGSDNKYGSVEQIEKRYRSAAYGLLKMLRLNEYLNGKGVTKGDYDKFTMKRCSIYKKKAVKKSDDSKPKKVEENK